MLISAILHEETQSGAPMLGDHLAMDLLNTEASDDGKAVEFWNNDQDVLQWFKAQGSGYQTRINTVLRAFRDASV